MGVGSNSLQVQHVAIVPPQFNPYDVIDCSIANNTLQLAK